MMEKIKVRLFKLWEIRLIYVPLPAFLLFCVTLVAALVHLLSRLFAPVADFFNSSLAGPVRFLLAKITDFVPFSIGETLLLALPVLLVLMLIGAIRTVKDKQRFVRCLLSLLSLLGLLYSLFVFTIGCGYHTTPLDRRLGLTRQDVTKEELYETALLLRERTAALAGQFARTDGAARMSYSMPTLNERLLRSYDSVCTAHPFIQHMDTRIKGVSISEAMSYTHITGVYSYMTGEANLNLAFPDYTLPFTAAHELAHQRGIARENEANFVAFLVCIASPDPFIQYSGYFSMMEYVASALYRADATLYREFVGGYSEALRAETIAYWNFYEKYESSVIGEISGSINNTYLQWQGTAGTQSYGMVVDLAVAYYKNHE